MPVSDATAMSAPLRAPLRAGRAGARSAVVSTMPVSRGLRVAGLRDARRLVAREDELERALDPQRRRVLREPGRRRVAELGARLDDAQDRVGDVARGRAGSDRAVDALVDE